VVCELMFWLKYMECKERRMIGCLSCGFTIGLLCECITMISPSAGTMSGVWSVGDRLLWLGRKQTNHIRAIYVIHHRPNCD